MVFEIHCRDENGDNANHTISHLNTDRSLAASS